ncbi:hypothetical protein ACSBR2_003940 [Camellia fascicularis]
MCNHPFTFSHHQVLFVILFALSSTLIYFVGLSLSEFVFELNWKMSTATFIDIILAIILPPLGVFLKFGCEVEFWICLILTLFGYLPGIIYAIYIITK